MKSETVAFFDCPERGLEAFSKGSGLELFGFDKIFRVQRPGNQDISARDLW